MIEKIECEWCEKTFEFDDYENDYNTVDSENSDGEWFTSYTVFCPHCKTWTRIL